MHSGTDIVKDSILVSTRRHCVDFDFKNVRVIRVCGAVLWAVGRHCFFVVVVVVSLHGGIKKGSCSCLCNHKKTSAKPSNHPAKPAVVLEETKLGG